MSVHSAGTRCALCGLRFDPHEAVLAFPPFVRLRSDPLHALHDAVAHVRCIEERPWGSFAVSCHEAIAANPVCVVCGSGAGDLFLAGFLSSDPRLDSTRFNFVAVHPGHLESWGQSSLFRSALSELTSSPDWAGPEIEFSPSIQWSRNIPDRIASRVVILRR
jgi:hypothetical protein